MKRYLSLLLLILVLFTSCADTVLTTLPITTGKQPSVTTPSLTTVDPPKHTTQVPSQTTAPTTTVKPPVTSAPVSTVPVTTADPPVTTTPETKPLDPDCHKDTDNNGKCDICDITVIVIVDFYAINDIHGKFKDSSTQIGVDELTTYLKGKNETDDYTVFLSSGDTWQGGSESNLTEGLIFTEWMNAMDFVSMTLGNHEFDWGSASVKKNAAAAEFPLLAINIYDSATNQPVDYVSPSVIVEKGGAKIGIIGAIGDCYTSIAADRRGDFYFKTGSALTALVKAESEKLRAQGADFIVYSLHDGYGSSKSGVNTMPDSTFSSYYDIALSNGYVDLVFEGHSHQSYVLKDSAGVYHLQGAGDNRGITHAEVSVNFANGKYSIDQAEYLPASRYEALESDPLVGELLDKHKDVISKGDEVLGQNRSYKDDEELEQLVADLYYEVGAAKWGQEYQLVLAGAFIRTRSPYNLKAGSVKYSQLLELFPFDNEIVLCSIKGKDLKRVFYETNNADYFICYSEYGESLRKNIKDNETYYVITDTYSSTYTYNNMTEIEHYDSGVYARDLLAEYIRDGKMA